MSTEAPAPRNQMRWVLPTVIFAFALALRLLGIGWGLKNDLHNQSYHPDEDLILAHSRSLVPGAGKLTPHFYNYGTLYLTVLRVASDVTTAYTGAPKVIEGADGFNWTNPERADWDWVSRCHLAGRYVSAMAGAATCLLLFLIVGRFTGNVGGIAAAAALAISPGHVVHSRFQTVDVTALFFLTASLWFAVRLLPTEEDPSPVTTMKWVVLAGVCAGLSAGTKYTGGLAILSLYAALLLAKRPKALIEGAIGTLAAAVAFVISTPGFLLEPEKFKADFLYELNHMKTGQGLVFVGTSSGFLYHIGNLMLGMGTLLLVGGVVGLVTSSIKRRAWVLVLLACLLPTYLAIGRAEVKYLRYAFPLFVGVAAGVGALFAESQRQSDWRKKVGLVLGAASLAGVAGGGLASTMVVTATMDNDPRDAAVRYLRQKPLGKVGLVTDPWYWTPPLFADSAELRSVPVGTRIQQIQTQANPPISYVLTPDNQLTQWDSKLITELKPERIVLSSFETEPMARLATLDGLAPEVAGQVDAYRNFKKLLDEQYVLESQFGEGRAQVEDMMYVEPVVWILKRKDLPKP